MASEDRIRELEKRVEQLSNEVGMLEDVNAIRKLQHAYGYYLDKCLYNEVVDLFSDTGEVCFLGGVFRGKAGVRRLYVDRFRKNFTNGKNGPVYGFMLDHAQLQEIIDVAPDRSSAFGRIRCLMTAGRHETAVDDTHPIRQWWEGGQYENIYTRENGVWKIKLLNYRPVWHIDHEKGLAFTRPQYVPFYTERDLYPQNPIGPDALTEVKPVLWPDTDIVAFHYPHPVTGKWVETV